MGKLEKEIEVLRKDDPDFDISDARIVVVVDQKVCPEICQTKLEAFAEKHDAERVDACTFHRADARDSRADTDVSAKTTIRTLTEPSPQEKIQERTGEDHTELHKNHQGIYRRDDA